MKKNVLWNQKTDYTVFSEVWCQTVKFYLGCDATLHSIMWHMISDYAVSICRRYDIRKWPTRCSCV